jgi:hypothetical protein
LALAIPAPFARKDIGLYRLLFLTDIPQRQVILLEQLTGVRDQLVGRFFLKGLHGLLNFAQSPNIDNYSQFKVFFLNPVN